MARSPSVRTYSRHSLQALKLFGALLRAARIERKISVASLAERVGISRDMLYRIA